MSSDIQAALRKSKRRACSQRDHLSWCSGTGPQETVKGEEVVHHRDHKFSLKQASMYHKKASCYGVCLL